MAPSVRWIVLCGLVLVAYAGPARPDSEDERKNVPPLRHQVAAKDCGITLDVVLEKVDSVARTVTARSTIQVVPPKGNVGGVVFIGTEDTPQQGKTTQFVRLPVMPPTDLKKLKTGAHVLMRCGVLHGALVVTGIEPFSGVERVGVDWLDAPGQER